MTQATLQDLDDYMTDFDRLDLDNRSEAILNQSPTKMDDDAKEMFGVDYNTFFNTYFDLIDKHRGEDWTTIKTNLTKKDT